jgi:hypothetical protein
MSVLTDTASYPITPATARHLERPLFGHVIDGEMVPSLDGATMPVIDPATGEQVATAAAGSAADVERAVRSARAALVYHTSHQVFADDPKSAKVLVGRYHNELSRTGDGWKISKLVFEILWGKAKTDVAGYLDLVGGRGPGVSGRR